LQQIKQVKSMFDGKHLLRACHHSICGLKAAFQKDVAFRQEVLLTIIIVPLALSLGITIVEKVILIGSWFLVLLVELINSSIEALVDRISLEIHPLSKKIKDMSSAAVFLSFINAAIIWAIILINYLLKDNFIG
jgi:diacylglycerol kinase (ATP)